LGQPLTSEGNVRLIRALALAGGEAAAVRALQDAVDRLCLIGVKINPESRVKAVQGPAQPSLVQNGWRAFLVKVHNEAGVTAELAVQSPNAAPLYRPSTGSPSPRVTVPKAEV